MSSESERRLAEPARHKSFLRGKIYFNNRRNEIDCLIRDFSASGARLIFSDSVTTPDVMDIYIPQKEQTLRAHVAWRSGGEVGVSFTAVETTEPSDADLAARVAKLEEEIAALKRMLKRMKADFDDPGSRRGAA